MLKKNEIIKLKITDINSEGFGVGRHNSIVVFVPFAAPDEEILCRIEKLGKSFCHARITEILTPSPHRVEPDCPVYYRCGGCSFRHIDYDCETEIKKNTVNSAISRLGGIDCSCDKIIPSPQNERYRNKAQFVVRTVDNKSFTGFFAPRSHRFVPIEDCLLQPAIFSKIAGLCCNFFDANNITGYNEENGSGMVRHLLLRQSEATKEIMLCVVTRKFFDITKLAQLLEEKIDQPLTVVININAERTNVILGKKSTTVSGSGRITERLFDVNYNIFVHSFFQVNTKGAEHLYGIVKDFAQLNGEEKVLDLYCGVGSIGLSVCNKNQTLLGVDIVKSAIVAAEKNAKRAGFINAKFLTGDAHTGLLGNFNPDLVILDPPRKGLDEKTIELLLKTLPDKIVMVSCNPSTAARDISKLKEAYNLIKMTAVDMFARCHHVESVYLLIKNSRLIR